ncbi:complement decay-accelerating factor-like [Emydura macquarii macquarii]|uniref:complement decay-accelerating factor-like n=1 Tax=Emydura macquarii macquarii TaxID=1129001 RepID=UPI00352A5B44
MTPLAPAARPGRRRRLLWLLGLVALLPAGAGGQCGALPTLSSAISSDTDRTEGFPVHTTVTYRCREGFVKIPGKSDTFVCLSNSQWSNIEEFCGRGCLEPPRLKSAVLTETDASKSYYPVGINVSYVCRPAYESTELSPVITCLENVTWSEAPEFCLGKSCYVPKGPEHGRPDDTTNHQFGAKVSILCDDGYRIIGDPFIWCLFNGDQVEWSKFPTCQLITCSPPPNITNGMYSGSSVENFDYNSSVTYKCNNNFLLTGEASIHCTTKDKTHGVWNGSAPECKVINTQDKPTTVPAGGADGGGNASVINTQDKPTTVPAGGADGGGNASGPGIGIGTGIGIGIVLKKINRKKV